MYTVWSKDFATGEGVTYSVLYTFGYGEHDDNRVNALEEFKRTFGSWYALGASVEEGLQFDFPGAKYLVSPEVQAALSKWTDANRSYHAQFHSNFS